MGGRYEQKRIAALEAELAEARKRIADMEAHDARWMSRHDDAQSALAFEKDAHARTQAEAAAKHNALVHAYEVLRCPTVRPSGHSGDEGSSNCDEDCAKCAVEGAIAHADEALDDASVGRRALAERVPLWRELERIVRLGETSCGHDHYQGATPGLPDCDGCIAVDVLRKLAALDEEKP